jgi:hypothetical protein
MKAIAFLGLLGGYLSGVTAVPVAEPVQISSVSKRQSGQTDACTTLGENPAGTIFKPSDIYACLSIVPIDTNVAAAFIDYLQVWIPFQSTLAYLKTPPSDYQFPSVDLVGGLTSIRNKVTSGGYATELPFELDLYNLFTATYDGHVAFAGALLGSGTYKRLPLVSVSSDGKEVPKIYLLSLYHR